MTDAPRPAITTDGELIWLPYPRNVLIGLRRCPDCGCHPEKQGHNPRCATTEDVAPTRRNNEAPRITRSKLDA